MGYDAYVKCNCYKTGKVKSLPPFPFEYDVYGNRRILTPECAESENSEKCSEQWRANYDWSQDACEHQNMDFIRVRVANTWGMSDFKWALNYIGASYFPILLEHSPEATSGVTEARFATPMLKELEYFSTLKHIAIGTYLIDSTTGQIIYDYIDRGGGVFAWYGTAGIDLGLDEDGFFVRKRPSNQLAGADMRDAIDAKSQPENMEIFRSKRFEQKLYLPESETAIENNAGYFEKSEEVEIELINLETNHRLVVKDGVSRTIYPQDKSGIIESVYPRFLHVEKRPFGSERYAYILEILQQLCQASIETSNPIIWY